MIHTAEIESSNLASPFVYDDEAQVLTVTFKGNGKRWEYFHVSQQEYETVAHPGEEFACSVGKAFAWLIKGHKTGRPVSI
jgi:hypothetical protein